MDLSGILSSAGVKRFISAALTFIAGILQPFPQAATALSIIQWVAGIFGFAGIAHAGTAGTLAKQFLATLAAIAAMAVTIAGVIPQLQPYQPILQDIATVLAAAAGGSLAATTQAKLAA